MLFNIISLMAQQQAAEFPASVPMRLRWEADSYSLADGASVETDWPDKTGNGYVGTRPATGNIGLVFKTNQLNGQPCIRLDGTSNCYFGVNGSHSGQSAYSFAIIWRINDITTSGGNNLSGAGTAAHYPFSGSGIYTNFGSNARRGPFSTLVTLSDFHVYLGWSASNDRAVYQNSSLLDSFATNTVSLANPMYIGFNGSQRMKVDVAAFYFAITKWSDDDITNLRSYWLAKYGL